MKQDRRQFNLGVTTALFGLGMSQISSAQKSESSTTAGSNAIQHYFFKDPTGIGTNTAIFTVVNAVLLKPLTCPDLDHIVQFLITTTGGNGITASIPKFFKWKAQTSVFQDVADYDYVCCFRSRVMLR
jgi:hypothetical protein